MRVAASSTCDLAPPRRDARSRLRLRFLRGLRLGIRFGGVVEGYGLANERLEGGHVNFLSFVDVYRAADVYFEAGVEEAGGIFQRCAFGEGELDDIFVGFAGADDAVVRPDRNRPLPFFHDVRVCCLDELAHSAEGFAAPVGEFGDSIRDEFRWRPVLARA